jgi:hypothetical protein
VQITYQKVLTPKKKFGNALFIKRKRARKVAGKRVLADPGRPAQAVNIFHKKTQRR